MENIHFIQNSKVVLVIGAASTGNKLMTSILIESGYMGYISQTNNFDIQLPLAKDHPKVVLRRSFPYGRVWPNLKDICHSFKCNGYENITVIVNMRNTFCTCKSQMFRGHVTTYSKALQDISKAYKMIFSDLSVLENIEYYIVSYDELIKEPYFTLKHLSDDLGLELSCLITIEDENRKHYSRDRRELTT